MSDASECKNCRLLRKVVEAARAAHGKHPQYVPGFGEHRALGKALAELDAAQEAE